MCSSNGVCSRATKNLLRYQEKKVFSGSPVLKGLCRYGCPADTFGWAGLWGARDRPCCGIAGGPGGLQWAAGPWGEPQGRGRGQSDPWVPSGPNHLLGALSFKGLQQVPWCLFKAFLCVFKSLTLGTRVGIFQNKYLKMKHLHLACFTGLQWSAYIHYFLLMGTQMFLCKHAECVFFLCIILLFLYFGLLI